MSSKRPRTFGGQWRYFGFMERSDIPAVLSEAKEKAVTILLDDVTYYVGRETVVSRGRRDRLFQNGRTAFSPRWNEMRTKVTDFFRLPVNDVVEIGREVAI